jgi:hypothetical protein
MQSGVALPVSWEAHAGEKIIEQLEQYSSCATVEDGQELLWIRRQEDTADRGIYRRYKPDGDIAVTASPVMMAFIMGEYRLAGKLFEHGVSLHVDDTAVEQSISESTTFMGSCSYTFFDLWFMDRDIPESLYRLSQQRVIAPGMYAYKPHIADDISRLPDVWLEALGRLHRVDAGTACYIAEELIKGVLDGKIMPDHATTWDELFTLFAQEREELIQIVFGFFEDCIFHQRHASREFGRMGDVLGIFLKYQKHITVSGNVFAFIRQMMMSYDYMCGRKQENLFWFMQMVPRFRDPPFPAAYRKDRILCIKRMMEYGTGTLMKVCFQNGFLKTELIGDYMELALTALSPYRKSCIVPMLSVMKWNMEMDKEDVDHGRYIQRET